MNDNIEIANAYGIKRKAALEIIEVLSEARGNSRKYKVLYEKALVRVGSKRLLMRDLNALINSGFLIKKMGRQDELIKISPYAINRELEEINYEHKLILERLKRDRRWINPSNFVREIRKQLMNFYNRKIGYLSVKIHIGLIFHQVKIEKNKNGNVRIKTYSDYRQIENNSTELEDESQFIQYDDDDELENNQDIFGNEFEESEDLDDLFPENEYEEEQQSDDTQLINGNIFTSDENSALEQKNNITNSEANDRLNTTNSTVEYIKQYFQDSKFVEVSEDYNKLILSVKIDNKSIAVIINFDNYKSIILISSYLEYISQCTEALLRLFSNIEMIGSLSIDNSYGKDFFIVRKIIENKRYNNSEIINIIDRVIFESNLAYKKMMNLNG